MERTNALTLLEAECEVVASFGDYRAYAQDLVLLRTLKQLGFEPQTIYDVGASDGIWSYLASWVFPRARFELFDPLMSENKYLHSRSDHPSLRQFHRQASVRRHEIALGSEDMSEGGLSVYPDLVGSTTLQLDAPPEQVEKRNTSFARLDTYAESAALPPPDLLKLDTQGSELDILSGAKRLLSSATAVLCECWLFQGYGNATPLWLDVANYLEAHDFDMFDFGWVYRRPSDQRPATVDVLFVRRGAEISPLHGYKKETRRCK